MYNSIIIFLLPNLVHIFIDLYGSKKAKTLANKIAILIFSPILIILLKLIHSKKTDSKYRIIVNKNRD